MAEVRERLGRPDWLDVTLLNVEDYEPAASSGRGSSRARATASDEMTLIPRERKRLRVEVELNGSNEPGSTAVDWTIQPL